MVAGDISDVSLVMQRGVRVTGHIVSDGSGPLPAGSVPAIQNVVWSAAPDLAFYSVATVDQLLSDTLAARRFATTLIVLFGVVALMLAGLGIYGVIAVATAQRTREIGLRIAMGAE